MLVAVDSMGMWAVLTRAFGTHVDVTADYGSLNITICSWHKQSSVLSVEAQFSVLFPEQHRKLQWLCSGSIN